MTGRLFVLAGPSGVGKGTVVRAVRDRLPGLEVSVSVTTRRPRPVERDGEDYRFVSEDAFDAMVDRGELLEWAEIFGHRSGTPADPVARARAQGRDVLLELDVQGARQVREREPEAVLILLEPPSLDELERRLRTRGTEDEATLARRLATASSELAQRDLFDHVVVNRVAERAADEVAAIIGASPQVNGPAGAAARGTEGSPNP